MIYVLYASLVALVIGFGLVLIRLQRGPSNLDRAVAIDVITSATVGILVVVMALSGRIDLLPLLVVFTSVGFIGSTTIARFSQAESISERRILTPEEAARTPEPVFADNDEPVHPDADLDADEDELDGDETDQAAESDAADEADPGDEAEEPVAAGEAGEQR